MIDQPIRLTILSKWTVSNSPTDRGVFLFLCYTNQQEKHEESICSQLAYSPDRNSGCHHCQCIDALGCSLLVMGIAQEIAGLMNIGQLIGFVVSFAILTFFSLGFTVLLFRNISDASSLQTSNSQFSELNRKEV